MPCGSNVLCGDSVPCAGRAPRGGRCPKRGFMMNDTQRAIVESKLTQILGFLGELEQVVHLPFEEYIQDFRNLRTTERTLELLVEISSDIVGHLLTEKGLPPANSYRNVFINASKADILSASLVDRIIPLVALRNRIIHEYDEQFDPKRAYDGFRLAPPVFRELAEHIFNFINHSCQK